MRIRGVVAIGLLVSVAAGCKGGGSTAQHDGEGEAGTVGGAGTGGAGGAAGIGGGAGSGGAGSGGAAGLGGTGGVAGAGAAGTGGFAGTTDAGTTDAAIERYPVDAAAPDASTTGVGGACSPDDWCWMAPLPQGNTLNKVWGFSATDVWAVGNTGALVHFDGTSWKGVRSGTVAYLYDVHGTGPTDVWAVGTGGTIVHYTGGLWLTTPVPSTAATSRLLGVWAIAADDAWAVGDNAVVHWNGAEWSAKVPTTATNATFYDVWATGPRDVWISTGFGPVHWDGTTWTSPTPFIGSYSIWGHASNDIWMAAKPIYRFDGMKWSTITVPYGDDPVISFVTGNAAGDVWTTSTTVNNTFASHLLRGGVWQDFEKPYGFSAIWSLSPDETWGVGGDGLIDRFRGGTWEQPLWDPAPARDFVGGTAPDDVWAVGYNGATTHFTGAGIEIGRIDGATRVNGFAAAAANDLWAVGSGGAVFHGDGRTWQPVNAGATADLQTVWASGPNDVWIGGGNGTLLRFDGTSWKRPSPSLSTSGTIYAIQGWGTNDVWVGGSGGQLSHFTGTSWRSPNMSAVPSTGESFWGIGGSGPTDVWLCGGSTWLYRWDETTNALVRKLLPADSRGTSWQGVAEVRGPAPNDLYLLGIEDAQAIMHWDGTRFTQQEVGVRARFASLWVASNGDTWLAGGPRVLRHRAAGP